MARISVPPNMTNESKKEASTDADTSLRKKSQKKKWKKKKGSSDAIKVGVKSKKVLSDYPPDHVTDPQLTAVQRILNPRLVSAIQATNRSDPSNNKYSNLTALWKSKKLTRFASPEDYQALSSLSGKARARKRKDLERVWERRERQFEKTNRRQGEAKANRFVLWDDARNVCEGCEVNATRSYAPKGKTKALLRVFVNGEERKPFSLSAHTTSFSVSAVIVTTYALSATLTPSPNRLLFLPHILYRWRQSSRCVFLIHSPLVLIVFAALSEEPALLTYVATHYLPPRVQFLFYLSPPSSEPQFPINLLRNIAIRHCATSHYLVMDIDLWPTRPFCGTPSSVVNLYDELMKLPPSVQASPTAAVIVPTFFFNRPLFLDHCFSYSSCVLLCLCSSLFTSSALDAFPENKTDLVNCLCSDCCHVKKNLIRTHVYVSGEWFTTPSSVVVSKVKCFIADMQEPYVLLPRLNSTPLYDERFVNYGYNKVQQIEHLRAAGFEFFILNNAFVMDMPHPDSTFRRDYVDGIRGDALRMRSVFASFLSAINDKYANRSRFPICTKALDSYYVPLE